MRHVMILTALLAITQFGSYRCEQHCRGLDSRPAPTPQAGGGYGMDGPPRCEWTIRRVDRPWWRGGR